MQDCLADIETILRAQPVPEPEILKVISFVRGSGLKALHDLELTGSIRQSLSISHGTSRVLASLCRVDRCKDLHDPLAQRSWDRDSVANDLRLLPHEEMRGLYLCESGLVIFAQTLSVGAASEVSIEPFTALRPAFLLGTRRMELMHNHPSGSAELSEQDVHSVRSLALLARGVGIHLEAVWTVGPDTLKRFEL